MLKLNCAIFRGLRCHVLLWRVFVAFFSEGSSDAQTFTTTTMLLCLSVLLYLSNPVTWSLIPVHVKGKQVQSRLWIPRKHQHGSIHVPSVQNPCARIRKGSCNFCNRWHHIKCINMDLKTYVAFRSSEKEWHCRDCKTTFHFTDSFFKASHSSDDLSIDDNSEATRTNRTNSFPKCLVVNSRSVRNKVLDLQALL